jgi:hypothetical protein
MRRVEYLTIGNRPVPFFTHTETSVAGDAGHFQGVKSQSVFDAWIACRSMPIHGEM